MSEYKKKSYCRFTPSLDIALLREVIDLNPWRMKGGFAEFADELRNKYYFSELSLGAKSARDRVNLLLSRYQNDELPMLLSSKSDSEELREERARLIKEVAELEREFRGKKKKTEADEQPTIKPESSLFSLLHASSKNPPSSNPSDTTRGMDPQPMPLPPASFNPAADSFNPGDSLSRVPQHSIAQGQPLTDSSSSSLLASIPPFAPFSPPALTSMPPGPPQQPHQGDPGSQRTDEVTLMRSYFDLQMKEEKRKLRIEERKARIKEERIELAKRKLKLEKDKLDLEKERIQLEKRKWEEMEDDRNLTRDLLHEVFAKLMNKKS